MYYSIFITLHIILCSVIFMCMMAYITKANIFSEIKWILESDNFKIFRNTFLFYMFGGFLTLMVIILTSFPHILFDNIKIVPFIFTTIVGWIAFCIIYFHIRAYGGFSNFPIHYIDLPNRELVKLQIFLLPYSLIYWHGNYLLKLSDMDQSEFIKFCKFLNNDVGLILQKNYELRIVAFSCRSKRNLMVLKLMV